MKSVREHMDMHAAYREVGTYRAAAEICGTTPKTVKRAVMAAGAAAKGENLVVEHNYDAVRDVIAARVRWFSGGICRHTPGVAELLVSCLQTNPGLPRSHCA